MARKQVLVQLDDELIERLDRLASDSRISRSELIRRAARALLELMAEAEADRQLVESYKRIPQEDWIVAAGQNMLAKMDLGPPPPE